MIVADGKRHELIEADLDAGEYIVRVYGFRAAKGSYLLFRTSGETDTARISENVNMDIPDAVGGIPGVADVDFDFEAPAGAVIRTLTIRDLDINHDWLPDLVVTRNCDTTSGVGVDHWLVYPASGGAWVGPPLRVN